MKNLEEVSSEWKRFSGADISWKDGRTTRYVYYASEEIESIAREAYAEFMSHNALSAQAFPSVSAFENNLVEFAANLLGNPQAVGWSSSGGTESIILAVKTARDWARESGRASEGGTIVVPFSAHPAFDKAAHLLGLNVVRIPLGSDFKVEVGAVDAAITEDCILLVGSAMCWPFGTVDPIVEMGRLAIDAGIPLHVDACAGGMLLPFIDVEGSEWDLRVPGVKSVSVDLHKYGYAGKGISLILYNDPEYASYQAFRFGNDSWPGGSYYTPTLAGTKPGGPIASAWAVVHALGHAGFRDLAETTMKAAGAWQQGIVSIDGLEVLGKPPASIFAYRALDIDTMAVGDEMQARGWQVGRQSIPPSIQVALNPPHLAATDDYLGDLEESVSEVRRTGAISRSGATYA